MAKQVISVDGEDVVVREDTAKSFRGVHWALLSLAAFVLIALVLFLAGFFTSATQGTLDKTPAEIEKEARP